MLCGEGVQRNQFDKPVLSHVLLQLIGNADDNLAHISQLVGLDFPTKASQMHLTADAAVRGDVSTHVRDRELIRSRKQPASLQGDGMERAIRQAVAVSVSTLKEQLAVRDDAVDPLMSGGEDEIPCWDTGQSTTQPGRRG